MLRRSQHVLPIIYVVYCGNIRSKLYEARLESYNKNIHQLWHQIFAETSVMNINLIIGNRNNWSFKGRLVNRRLHQNNQRQSRNKEYEPIFRFFQRNFAAELSQSFTSKKKLYLCE